MDASVAEGPPSHLPDVLWEDDMIMVVEKAMCPPDGLVDGQIELWDNLPTKGLEENE